MDLRQITYFVALFEEGSVTRAANRLNVVQPAVSMQIARLERDLGQVLFERRSKAMVPTSAGRTLHRLVLPVLRHMTLAREHMAKLSGVVSGHITIGILASLAVSMLPAMLVAFAKEYPEVEVTVVDGYSSTFIDLVNQGALDFAIINKPARKLGLILDPLIQEQMVYVAAAGAKLEKGTVSVNSLAEEKLILPSRRHGLRVELERHFSARDIAPEMQLEMDSIQGIIELVAGSDWRTILPSLGVRRAVELGLVQTRPIRPSMTRQLAIIHHPQHPLSPAADTFIIRVHDYLGAHSHHHHHK